MKKSRLERILRACDQALELVYQLETMGNDVLHDESSFNDGEPDVFGGLVNKDDPFFKFTRHDGYWLQDMGTQIATIISNRRHYFDVYEHPVRLKQWSADTYTQLTAYLALDVLDPLVVDLNLRFAHVEFDTSKCTNGDLSEMGTDYDREYWIKSTNLLRLQQIDVVELNAAVDRTISDSVNQNVLSLRSDGDIGWLMTALQHENWTLWRRFPKSAKTVGKYLGLIVLPYGITRRGGFPVVNFGNRSISFRMVLFLLKSGTKGLSREMLYEKIYGKRSVNSSNLDKAKAMANELLNKLRIEIVAAPGRWHLAELPLTQS